MNINNLDKAGNNGLLPAGCGAAAAPEEPPVPPATTLSRQLWLLTASSTLGVAVLFLSVWWLGQAGIASDSAGGGYERLAGNSVDDFVLGNLARRGIEAQPVCGDEAFVRRVHLDVIGRVPTLAEARTFLADQRPDKRARLIETLLAREEFADYWAMKWGDLLRIKAEFPVNLWPNAAQAYHQWVRAAIATNKPYDRFARELLTSSGSNFRVGPANFYRAMQDRSPEGIAGTVALTFMGVRTENWPDKQLAGFAGFFTQVGYKPSREWKEEIVFWDAMGSARATNYSSAPATGEPLNSGRPTAKLPNGTLVTLPPELDPREVFADWLVTPQNPWFTRNIANRVWSWLMGRGIIEPADDIRENNPPSNSELLAFLERELIRAGYDMKQLYRLILNSKTYQFSSQPEAVSSKEAAIHFASYPLRRLEAEVLVDAINQITGTAELYTSPIPEPFTYIPTNTPAVALADGSITSSFLALFGRSARATGQEDERNNQVLPAQMLHLLNSSHIGRKLDQGPALRALLDSRRPAADVLDDLYLTVLSRHPRPDEALAALAYSAPAVTKGGRTGSGDAAKSAPKKREDWVDITWALINSDEFLFRH